MIETERLVLRRFREVDRAPFRAMLADPVVMANLAPVHSADSADAVIARHEGYWTSGARGFWVAAHRETGAFVGHVGLKPGAPNTPIAGEVEIGWLLARRWWRQGYAREAALATLASAWQGGASAVAAIVSAGNDPSRGLMARLGMVESPDDAFDHPDVAADDPRRHMVVYRTARDAAT